MALPHAQSDDFPATLTEEQSWQLLDDAAMHWLGISAHEFLQRWDAGAFGDIPDTPEGWRIMRVAYLIPFVRPESEWGRRALQPANPRVPSVRR
jgi:hypothetical protein